MDKGEILSLETGKRYLISDRHFRAGVFSIEVIEQSTDYYRIKHDIGDFDEWKLKTDFHRFKRVIEELKKCSNDTK